MSTQQRVTSTEIRTQFALAMSDMYRREVPMYGTLVDMVQQINQQELENNPELRATLDENRELLRLSAERHGAIRLGKAEELFTMRRLFAVMGMHPVAYYDLTEAGIPVHSTAFRPLEPKELNASPFRIFTSLLRLDLVKDKKLRHQAEQLLSERVIFNDSVLNLIQLFEQQNGLTREQANAFVTAALETFRWHQQATVDLQTYQKFLETHRLLADIVCFRGPHINHLTPRTLNIDHAQQQMTAYGLIPKVIVEGPPKRRVPILLRQTSFKALDEKIEFIDAPSSTRSGSHTARFGEIEQRGMALTPKGRALYDYLLESVRRSVPDPLENTNEYYRQLYLTFKQFPDDIHSIHQHGLGYFNYSLDSKTTDDIPVVLQTLIDHKIIKIQPLTYEDFLPVSAAGIFQSNLDGRDTQDFIPSPNQQAFEQDLGCAVVNEFEYYARIQYQSLQNCLQQLGLNTVQQQAILDGLA